MQLLKVEGCLPLQEGDPVDSDYDTPGDISDTENPENQVCGTILIWLGLFHLLQFIGIQSLISVPN